MVGALSLAKTEKGNGLLSSLNQIEVLRASLHRLDNSAFYVFFKCFFELFLFLQMLSDLM